MKSHSSIIPLIDRSDFDELYADGRFGRWSEQARDVHRNGFCQLDIGDPKFNSDCEELIQALAKRMADDLADWEAMKKESIRIQDGWKEEPVIRRLALHPQILDLLHILYGRKPFAFQTLNFAVGSQQHYHSDAVHFHSQPHGFMCGVWIPLDDVLPESGPLIYFPGSHRLPYQNAVTLGLTPEQVAAESHPQRFFEPLWQMDVKRLGLEPKIFLPKRGQVLIWHANLLHGGSPVASRKARRWSQVIHYYFEDCLYTTPMKSFRPDQGGAFLRNPVDIATGESISKTTQRLGVGLSEPHTLRSNLDANACGLNQSRTFWRRVYHAPQRLKSNHYKGNLELITPSLITGWIYHPTIVMSDVRLVCGNHLVATALLDDNRSDVCLALGVEGRFGFKLEIPDNHPEPNPQETLRLIATSPDSSTRIDLKLPGSMADLTESRLRLAMAAEYRGMRGHFDGFSTDGDKIRGWCFSTCFPEVGVWLHAEGLQSRKVPCNIEEITIPGHGRKKCGFVLSVNEWPDVAGKYVWASLDFEGILRLPPI
jgi:hypothetical protein